MLIWKVCDSWVDSVALSDPLRITGACEASCACSTCHVILEPEVFDQLEEPSDDENDMLDLAFALTDTWVSLNDFFLQI